MQELTAHGSFYAPAKPDVSACRERARMYVLAQHLRGISATSGLHVVQVWLQS